MLMSPNKDETAVLGCHCPGNMAVRMLKVLALPRGWCSGCLLLLLVLLLVQLWGLWMKRLNETTLVTEQYFTWGGGGGSAYYESSVLNTEENHLIWKIEEASEVLEGSVFRDFLFSRCRVSRDFA